MQKARVERVNIRMDHEIGGSERPLADVGGGPSVSARTSTATSTSTSQISTTACDGEQHMPAPLATTVEATRSADNVMECSWAVGLKS